MTALFWFVCGAACGVAAFTAWMFAEVAREEREIERRMMEADD